MKWYDYLVAPILIAGFAISGVCGLLLIVLGVAITAFGIISYVKERRRKAHAEHQ